MSKETERKLIDWENNDPEDDIHWHFKSFGRWHWCHISDEGRRVWNMMFPVILEEGSPADAVFCGIAAQASHGAFAAIAAALGVDREALEIAVSEWYGKDKNPPAAVKPDELMTLIEESRKWLAEIKSPNAEIEVRDD